MSAGELCELLVPAQSATRAVHLVCGHRLAIAGAAENNCAIALTADCSLGRGGNELGIIDRIVTERAEVADLVPERIEQLLYLFLETKAGVICPERDFHVRLLPPASVRCREKR